MLSLLSLNLFSFLQGLVAFLSNIFEKEKIRQSYTAKTAMLTKQTSVFPPLLLWLAYPYKLRLTPSIKVHPFESTEMQKIKIKPKQTLPKNPQR